MWSVIKSLFRKKPVHNARLLDRAHNDCRVHNAQFVSFLSKSGFRQRALAQHDKTKRIKQAFGFVFMWSLILGFVWVAIESTQSLELF